MARRILSVAAKVGLVAFVLQLFILYGAARAASASEGKTADVDFPPGTFSDGQHYKLSDFQGKVLVIFFYESSCPHCAERMPAYDALFAKYKDKPIKFIGIGSHDSLSDVKEYITEHKLHVPFFADPLSIMGPSYNTGKISLQNVMQFRVIGADGGISAGNLSFPIPTDAEIDALLKGVKWKYKDDGYSPALNQAIELLEWNQFESGMRVLRPFLKSYDKTVAASAQKLYDRVKGEGQGWKDQADKEVDSDPVDAFDLYSKVAGVFAGDELGKSVEKPLAKLKTNKAVTEELAARQMFGQLYVAMGKVNSEDKKAAAQVEQFCTNIMTKYPGTPTADRAGRILKNLAASGY